jgi:hypothetical protein
MRRPVEDRISETWMPDDDTDPASPAGNARAEGPRLRRVLIRDQADRDAIASQLMGYRDENGQRWADVLD